MSQIYGQIKDTDGTTKWKPIKATLLPDGNYALVVDTELVLDGANISISNIKVGSVNQTVNTNRYLKTEDDGTVVTISSPLDLYEVSDTADGFYEDNPGINFYGYVSRDEDWYILEETVTPVGTDNNYKYFKGSGNYSTAWTNKAGHSYDYFYNIF